MRRFICALAATAVLVGSWAAPVRAGLLTDLKAHWRLNEASSTRVDAHASNDLTDNNTVTQNPGKLGDAAQFTNANSEFLSITDNADLSMGDIDFSIAIWAYLDNKTTGQALLAKWVETSNSEYMLRYDDGTDRLIFSVTSGGTDATRNNISATTFGSPPTATWMFIVAWHDAAGNTIKIQVDNGTADSTAHTGGVYDGTAAFKLGAINSPEVILLDARLDSVSIWKRVLTSGERTDLYNGGSGFDYPFTTAAAKRAFGVIIYSAFPLGGLW